MYQVTQEVWEIKKKNFNTQIMFTDHHEIKLEMDNKQWKLKDLELSTLNAL